MTKPKYTWYAIRRPKPPNFGNLPTENVPLLNHNEMPCQSRSEACFAVDALNSGWDDVYTYQLVDMKKTQKRFCFRDTWQERKTAVSNDEWLIWTSNTDLLGDE